MPVISVTPQEQQAAMEAGSSELKYQRSKEGVRADVQSRILHYGATSLAKFAAFFQDKEEVRKVAKDELGVDPGASLSRR